MFISGLVKRLRPAESSIYHKQQEDFLQGVMSGHPEKKVHSHSVAIWSGIGSVALVEAKGERVDVNVLRLDSRFRGNDGGLDHFQ